MGERSPWYSVCTYKNDYFFLNFFLFSVSSFLFLFYIRYEGGLFELDIVVPKRYPLQPPVIHFLTKIFHPNIHWEVSRAAASQCSQIWFSFPRLEKFAWICWRMLGLRCTHCRVFAAQSSLCYRTLSRTPLSIVMLVPPFYERWCFPFAELMCRKFVERRGFEGILLLSANVHNLLCDLQGAACKVPSEKAMKIVWIVLSNH